MPEYERGLERHERSAVVRNQSRGVVSWRARRGNSGTIYKSVGGTGEALTTIHIFPDRGLAIPRFRVEFDSHGIGIEIVKEDSHLKEILLPFLFNCRGTESQP